MMIKRSGFTLFELIIVIFLMLLIYSIVFANYQKKESQPQSLTPLNLKEILQKTIPSDQHATFLCANACETCYLRIGDENSFVRYKNEVDLKNTEAYAIDQNEALSLLEYGKFKGDDVCLKIDFYPNRSSTQIVIKHPKGVYFLPSFFGNTQKVGTLEEAKELWLKNDNLVSDPGDYY